MNVADIAQIRIHIQGQPVHSDIMTTPHSYRANLKMCIRDRMELEFFCEPGTDLEWFAYWKQYCIDWLKDLRYSC